MSRKSVIPKRSVTVSILAVIGGVSVIVGLGFLGKDQWDNHTRLQASWPAPYRDCVTAGAPRLSDKELIAKAIAQREDRLRMYSEAYKKQYVDGPVVTAKSRVYRWETPRNHTEADRRRPNDDAPGYMAGQNAAQLGLNRYATVELVMEAVSREGLTQEYTNSDICGYGF